MFLPDYENIFLVSDFLSKAYYQLEISEVAILCIAYSHVRVGSICYVKHVLRVAYIFYLRLADLLCPESRHISQMRTQCIKSPTAP